VTEDRRDEAADVAESAAARPECRDDGCNDVQGERREKDDGENERLVRDGRTERGGADREIWEADELDWTTWVSFSPTKKPAPENAPSIAAVRNDGSNRERAKPA